MKLTTALLLAAILPFMGPGCPGGPQEGMVVSEEESCGGPYC